MTSWTLTHYSSRSSLCGLYKWSLKWSQADFSRTEARGWGLGRKRRIEEKAEAR